MDEQAVADTHTLLARGIKAAQAKQKTEAYRLLGLVVDSEPDNVQALLWLAAVAPTPQESLAAFQRVLAIAPENEPARVGRRWAAGRIAQSTPPPPSEAPAEPVTNGATAPAADDTAAPVATTAAAPGARPSRPITAPLGPAPETLEIPPPEAEAGPPPRRRPTAPLYGPPAIPDTSTDAEWRAAGDLAVPTDTVNWDDDGAGLQSTAPTEAGARGVTCPNCGAPGQTGPACSLCATPLAPQPDESTGGATPSAAAPVPAAPVLPAEAVAGAYPPALSPVAPRPSLWPLMLGGLLVLGGLFVLGLGLGWFGAGAITRFDQAGQRFFEAQIQHEYDVAAGLLAPSLKSQYLPGHDLPLVQLDAALSGMTGATVESAPWANDPAGTIGESLVTIQPQAGPPVRYEVHLVRDGDQWLIDQILPYRGTGP